MPQTMQVFVAVLVLATITLSQRSAKLRSYQNIINGEMQMMAHGVGTEVAGVVGAKSFDDYTVGGRKATSVDSLTPLPFSSEPVGSRDDIDDYHGVRLTRVFVAASDTVDFSVDVKVFYLTDAGKRTHQRTFNKEVVVTVQENRSDGDKSLMISPITLKRVLSYEPS